MNILKILTEILILKVTLFFFSPRYWELWSTPPEEAVSINQPLQWPGESPPDLPKWSLPHAGGGGHFFQNDCHRLARTDAGLRVHGPICFEPWVFSIIFYKYAYWYNLTCPIQEHGFNCKQVINKLKQVHYCDGQTWFDCWYQIVQWE